MQLTLIRHAQSEGNAARLWQGRGNAPLTARGRSQARALGRRVDLGHFDRVVSSTLDRAVETARLAGFEAEPRESLVEMDLGEWDGLTFDQVSDRFPDELAALRAGEPIRWGGTGETVDEFTARITSDLAAIIEFANPDDRILIVGHGGTNNTILGNYLQTDQHAFRLFGPMTNTGITQLEIDENGRAVVERYNDSGHLGPLSDWTRERLDDGAVALDFVRHGVTDANLEHRVQGQADWGLHVDGEEQARRLAEWIGAVDFVYTSPSGRAARTAQLAFPNTDIVCDERLMEIAMGEWQGRLWPEVLADFADEIAAMQSGREDVRRGRNGENFEEVQRRMTASVQAIAERHPGSRLGVVSHGLAIRSYIAGILSLDHTSYRSMQRLGNTAVSRVVVTSDGPLISEYNVAYHLNH